jgi:hypothetical protein
MPQTNIGPSDRLPSSPNSSLLWHWEGSECLIDAVTGEAATFSRASTGTALDSAGTSRTAVNDQPRWTWEDLDSDSVRETPCLSLGASGELIKWSFYMKPNVPFTLLIEFVENGAKAVANAGVLYIGNDAATGARFYVDSSGTQYRVTHNNGTSAVTSTMTGTAPTTGQRVRLRVTYATTGAVRIHQTIGTGGETSATASGVLAPTTAWSNQLIRLGSLGTANVGLNKFVRAKMAYGSAVSRDSISYLR